MYQDRSARGWDRLFHDVLRGSEILNRWEKHSRGKGGPEEGNSLVRQEKVRKVGVGGLEQRE